jgi:ribonuclease VapC
LKLLELKPLDQAAIEAGITLIGRIEPLTTRQARMEAELRSRTKQFGLSLGDRACLALALDLGLDVHTADRAWSQVNVGCGIHLVR